MRFESRSAHALTGSKLSPLHPGGVFSRKVDFAAKQYKCTCDCGSIAAKETDLFYQYL